MSIFIGGYMAKLSTADLNNIVAMLKELHTYEEIGNKFGVSKERIRQIARKHSLQGLRLHTKKASRIAQELANKKEKYGQFISADKIDEPEFLRVCKAKYRQKKFRVSSNSAHTWDIPFKDIVWSKVCPILGIPLDYYAISRQENSPSFGRIDSNVGYVSGNVIIVSWRANRIKNDGTAEEHKKIAQFLSSLSK
jgi:transposase